MGPCSQGHPYEAIGGVQGSRHADTSRRRRHLLRVAVSCGAMFCLVGFWMAVRSTVAPERGAGNVTQAQLYGRGRSRIAGRKEGLSADDSVQVLVSNKYQRDRATSMYPWEHVAEPERDTRLEILSWPARDGAALDYSWRVNGEVVGTGEAINVVFSIPGAYKGSVRAYPSPGEREDGGDTEESVDQPPDGDGERASRPAGQAPSTRSSRRIEGASVAAAPAAADADAVKADKTNPENQLDFVVTVKYVRREIRKMTDRDRETFFNAVAVMQRVPSAVGRAVYGNKYYSKDYFNRMHLYYGGRKDCDHWHSGAGFVTSHIAISLMYEQSLQAINPSIALPYWDFTIEGTFYDWSNFRDSPVFSDDWFGDAAPQNAIRTPASGRFGYVPTMMNATDYSEVHNSYGMLRSPWNNDPTPYLTRSDHLMGYMNHRKPSGCRKYRQAMQTRTWMDLTVYFNEDAHGEIHELLGGSWSRGVTAYADRTSTIVQPFVHKAVPLLKLLWRAGYIGCPDTCAIDVPWEKCACTCSDAAFGGQAPWEVLEDAGVLEAGFFYDKQAFLISSLVDEEGNAYEVLPGYTKEETVATYDELLRTLCTPMRFGTHYGATSTNDPTFHLIHSTFDRLWHLQRLEANPNFDETWTPDNVCYGHNPDDTQPFHDLFLEDASSSEGEIDHKTESVKRYYTNNDLYARLRPDKEQGIFIRGF